MHLNSVLLSPKVLWILAFMAVSPLLSRGQTVQELKDLSAFKNPGPTWKMVGSVRASLEEAGELSLTSGSAVLVNDWSKRDHGKEIGRASCGERGCLDGEDSWGG